jgi:hypothetical protein
MRWSRLFALYVVAALLGAEYWWIERPGAPEPVEQEGPRARMFPIDPGDVVRVDLGTGARHVVLALEEGTWTIVRPTDRDIPRDLIQAFVTALVGAEIIDWVPADAEPAERFGFGPEAARVRMWDREGTAWSIEIGAVSPTGTAVYVRRPDGSVALLGRNAQYYLDLIVGAARGAPTVEPDIGQPVAAQRLTIGHRAG